MAAYNFADVNLGIDPSTRAMVDSHLPEITKVLKDKTTKGASLFIQVLMSDKRVITYLGYVFGFSHTGDNIISLYSWYGSWFSGTGKYLYDSTSSGFTKADPFFLGALNFEDQALEYLDRVLTPIEDYEDWELETVDLLMAGAYFGGHDHLINLIKARINKAIDQDIIIYTGLVGAVCAGRYHYIEQEYTLIDNQSFINQTCTRVINEHFIPTRENAERSLIDHPLPGQEHFDSLIIYRLLSIGTSSVKLWFLNTDLAQKLRFEDIPPSLWLFFRNHKNDIRLNHELMSEIESIADSDFNILWGVAAGDTEYLKAMFKDGRTIYQLYLSWAKRYQQSNVIGFIHDYLKRKGVSL